VPTQQSSKKMSRPEFHLIILFLCRLSNDYRFGECYPIGIVTPFFFANSFASS